MSIEYEKACVTGGAGFIGSHLVDMLLDKGLEVVVIDNLSSGSLRNIDHHKRRKDFRFVDCDIRYPKQIKTILRGVDVVFHEAALSSVEVSTKNPSLANSVNVTGTLNLLVVASSAGVKRFVYASSSAVYGDAGSLPIGEETPTRPLSPYGVSKLSAEYYVRVFDGTAGLRTVCLRYFNVYGLRQEYSPYSSVMTSFLRCLLMAEPLTIHGDGEQTRDFVHIQDVVEANMLAMTSTRAVGQVFNIGSGKSVSINELAAMLSKAWGKLKVNAIHSDSRALDVRHSCANIAKAGVLLNYHPKCALHRKLLELAEASQGRQVNRS